MRKIFVIALLIVLIAGCNDQVREAPPHEGMRLGIEWYGENNGNITGETFVQAEIIGKGFIWSEGPVWVEKMQSLLVSDVPGNIIYQWSKDKGQQVYLRHAGFADTLDHRGSDGSNGLALDRNDRLIICQSGARRIVRMKSDVGAPAHDFELLADNYQGKKFNSPNDLVIDRNNAIYFTDPVYGLPGKDKDPGRELNFEGIFRISTDGRVRLLIDSIPKPNGITLSPDEKMLYIASSDEKRPAWYAYELTDSGTIKSFAWVLDALQMREKATIKQSPDGLRTDNQGMVYSSGPEGVSIITPAGKLSGLIKVRDRFTSNCAFNTKKDTLFITVDDIVISVPFGKGLKKQ